MKKELVILNLELLKTASCDIKDLDSVNELISTLKNMLEITPGSELKELF